MLYHYAECVYVECRILFVVMLNVFMVSVVMLNVITLSVIMLSVIMLNVYILSVVMLNVITLSVVMLSVLAPSWNLIILQSTFKSVTFLGNTRLGEKWLTIIN
jgi:hypothetical protein